MQKKTAVCLVWMYTQLARQEEREVRAELGAEYDRYASNTPAFFPRLGDTTNRSNT